MKRAMAAADDEQTNGDSGGAPGDEQAEPGKLPLQDLIGFDQLLDTHIVIHGADPADRDRSVLPGR